MRRVLDFLFPIECVACGAVGTACCVSCLGTIPIIPKFMAVGSLRVVSAYAYAHPLVRRLLHDLKYERWTCMTEPIGQLARRWAMKTGALVPRDAVLVPVPLHASRLRERGFNQAELLARAFGEASGRSLKTRFLERWRETASQTATGDRGRNVVGAFRARLPWGFRRPILLIDDVVTTGATLRACAAALRGAGAEDVRAFALAWGTGHPDDGSRRPC